MLPARSQVKCELSLFFVTMCAAKVTPTGDRSLVQNMDQGKADPNVKQQMQMTKFLNLQKLTNES